MLTKAAIMVNFKKAMQQADELDEIANSLSRSAKSELEGTLQSVSANWKGENAERYLTKGDNLQGKIYSSAKSLHGIAADIRKVARKIYDAEMRALAVAETRNYK